MNKSFSAIKILAVVGIVLALYLLWQQIFPQQELQVCNISENVNCDAIISGQVANTFGVSTPLIGLIGYIVIFFAAEYKKKKLALWMSTFGLIFCMWIAYRELFELNVICPICIACQLIMTIVFITSIVLNLRKNIDI